MVEINWAEPKLCCITTQKWTITSEDFCDMVRAPIQKKRADLCSHTKSTLEPQPSNERMKLMTRDSSATAHPDIPHVIRTTRTNTIVNALKRRAQAILNDKSIDPQSRAILRYAMETNAPWLARLVRSADADEDVVEAIEANRSEDNRGDDSNREKIEALAEIVCRAGEEASGALFVLMGTMQNSTEPRAIANTVKHFAFTRCGEFNLYGMVDAQIAIVEDELLARMS
jgi:hypothetical protein